MKILEMLVGYSGKLNLEQKALKEPFCQPLLLPYQWEVAAPCPQLICKEGMVELLFVLAADEQDVLPKQKGRIIFKRCISASLLSINDEVLSGHSLYEKGLSAHNAFIIENSTHIAEIENVHKAHPYYNASRWKGLKHYLFAFKDSMVECIAEDFEALLSEQSVYIASDSHNL